MKKEIQYNLDSVGNFKLFGFATGSYACECTICGASFTGDKRSCECLDCALKKVDNLISMLSAYQQGVNQIEDFLEYTYLNMGVPGIKNHIMEIVDGITEQLKSKQ